MSDKILKLDQAQTLYQDLRGRIDALPTSGDIPEVPVQDVQINGTSIIQNGVANVPVADQLSFGVVKLGSTLKNVNNTLMVNRAGGSVIKTGTDSMMSIMASSAHFAAFYGLAKAAGADMKDIAETTVGVYPDAQKTAIKEMLGVQDGLKVVRLI